jgi:glycosyltransferase involved in cell wall biosynthesis
MLMPHLEVGGLQRATYNLARHVTDDVTMCAVTIHSHPYQASRFFERDLREHADVFSLDVLGRADRSPTALARAVHKFRRFVREWRPDIVDSATFEADLVARASHALGGHATISHLINTVYEPALGPKTGRGSWRPAAVRWIDRQTARLSNGHVAITETVRSSAVKSTGLPGGRIAVIPRGVDLAHFSVGIRNWQAHPRKLLTAARLTHSKNIDNLLRAAALARSRGANMSIMILGEGPDETALRRQSRDLGVNDIVSFAGAVSDIRPIFAAHQGFVLGSRWEGLGNALLEAMATGAPVIVSDIPTFREVVSQPLATFPPEDVEGYAQALMRFADAPTDELIRLGAASRCRVEKAYDIRVQTQAMVDHWRTTARQRRVIGHDS